MNDKQKELHRILKRVVSCCTMEMSDGSSINGDDITGKLRTCNAVMTRCILVAHLLMAGYSVNTVAQFLNRSVSGIHYLQNLDRHYMNTSRAYRIASKEVTRLGREEDATSSECL